jgi:hypothetical protein
MASIENRMLLGKKREDYFKEMLPSPRSVKTTEKRQQQQLTAHDAR